MCVCVCMCVCALGLCLDHVLEAGSGGFLGQAGDDPPPASQGQLVGVVVSSVSALVAVVLANGLTRRGQMDMKLAPVEGSLPDDGDEVHLQPRDRRFRRSERTSAKLSNDRLCSRVVGLEYIEGVLIFVGGQDDRGACFGRTCREPAGATV